MKNKTLHGIHFCGNKASDYAIKNGYLDYRTLSKAFDAVLCNDITKLFYSTISGEYNEAEQVNGYIDNSDAIDELQEQIDELTDEYRETDDSEKEKELESKMDELQEQIDELQREQDEQPEVFQWFIISDAGADILKDWTNELLYYIPALDIYVWGVTHYGTSWDYVLTDIKLNGGAEND